MKVEKLNSNGITVIIPTFNEEEGIGPTLTELTEMMVQDPRYIVVDGNSTDKTAEIARQMGASVVMQKGVGKGSAVAQALRFVDSDTRYVVFIDADFTYPAGQIPGMVRILEGNPGVGMVTGKRFHDHSNLKEAMRNINFLGNMLLAAVHSLLNGAKLDDPLTGLRVVRWEILKRWRPRSQGFDIEVELNSFIRKRGKDIVEVPIQYRSRLGQKKLRVRDGLPILRRILLQSVSSI